MPSRSCVSLCTHVKVNGIRCGSPALRGEQFCYFHQRMFRTVPAPPDSRLHPVALLESDEAIQASLMEVIHALVRNTIDLKRADLILKALYIAVKNSRRSRFDIWQERMVREVPEFANPAAQSTTTEVHSKSGQETSTESKPTGAPSLPRSLRERWDPARSAEPIPDRTMEALNKMEQILKGESAVDPHERKPPTRVTVDAQGKLRRR